MYTQSKYKDYIERWQLTHQDFSQYSTTRHGDDRDGPMYGQGINGSDGDEYNDNAHDSSFEDDHNEKADDDSNESASQCPG